MFKAEDKSKKSTEFKRRGPLCRRLSTGDKKRQRRREQRCFFVLSPVSFS